MKKEKIGCPITLGEYEEIVRKEKEENKKDEWFETLIQVLKGLNGKIE